MAKLQRELLEAAIDATKVGGIIVYSTCTLTPEENEEVISSMLRKFPDQVEVVDPREIDPKFTCLQKGIEDSILVQTKLGFDKPFPVVRLWPQTYDTEGFFCAVLRKLSPTRHVVPQAYVHFQEVELPAARLKDWAKIIEGEYGTSFMDENDRLFQRGELLLLANKDVASFRMPVADYALGIPFGKIVEPAKRMRIDHDIIAFRGTRAKETVTEIDQTTLDLLLDGKDATCDPTLSGDVVLIFKGMAVGLGLAKQGLLKNRLPRWIVQKS
jgi:16S rRNA (cytosine1407-C5)-methyltransferase